MVYHSSYIAIDGVHFSGMNTIHQDVAITTSQTGLIVDFINRSIEYEELRSNDIVMLKYLKRIDNETYSIY